MAAAPGPVPALRSGVFFFEQAASAMKQLITAMVLRLVLREIICPLLFPCPPGGRMKDL
jgi:hypothetical protein